MRVSLISCMEKAECAHKLICLARQLFCRGCHFLRSGSVLLNDLLELLKCLIDLLGAGILLLARRCDLLHQIGRALDIRHELIEHLPGLLRNLHRRAGELIDLSCCLLTPFRKLADFRSHHGKALAMLTGTGASIAALSASRFV